MAAPDPIGEMIDDLKAKNVRYLRFELARFHAHVTDWNRNEYLEVH